MTAVPVPGFRDQLAGLIGHRGGTAARRCKSRDGGACNCPAGRTAAEIEAFVAAEVEARVQAADAETLQRVRGAMDVMAYRAERAGTGAEEDALDDALTLLRAALASPAPVPHAKEGQR